MSHFRRYGTILAMLTGLALLITWPLVTRLATHVPGSDTWAYDEYTFIWSMWWFQHALLDLRESIFFSQYIFYPLGMELILYSYNLLAAILGFPLGLATNWPFASNITLLFSMVISGFGTYLLALWVMVKKGVRQPEKPVDLTLIRGAAIVAGIIYAYASNRLIYLALGHYNIQSWQFLPFFILYLLRLMDRPTRVNAIMAGFFAALNLLVDMQFGVFMAFLGGCLLLTKPLRSLLIQRPQNMKRWMALLGMVAVAVLITLPYFLETLRSLADASYLLPGWGDALKLSADMAGWFTPTALHPVWGTDWVQRLREVQEGTAPFSDVNTVFLGYSTLALAVVGAVSQWRRVWGWVLAALLSGLFTLGPLLQIYGQTVYDFDGLESTVPLPFLILHYIPIVQGNRVANRWSIVLMLTLAILAAWGLLRLMTWLRDLGHATSRPRLEGTVPRVLMALAVLFILFEHLALPLPLTDARVPAAVQALGDMPDGAILQIPMGWRNSFGVLGTERTQAQYYMSAHEKPILSGNTSRNPPFKFEYFQRLPLVDAITRQEFGEIPDAEIIKTAKAQAHDLMTLWGVRYLLLLPPVPGRLPYADHWQESQQLALELIPHSPEPLLKEGNIQIWGVEPGSPLPLELDFGGQDTEAWRADGWSDDEPDVGGVSGIWANDREAGLIFRSEDEMPRLLTFRSMPFDWPDASPQFIILTLNDERIGQASMSPGWADYQFELQPQVGINRLQLDFSRADTPRSVLGQAYIGSTGRQAPVNIDVHSFDQAYISLFDENGMETPASFGRRGYNVTVIHPRTGEVVSREGFDTVANVYEVDRLIETLDQLPSGHIVILATREGTGDYLSARAVTALQKLGSGVDDVLQIQGKAHALVGIVGAEPGTAAEVIDEQDAFLRIAGDHRTLAAAFDWLKIE